MVIRGLKDPSAYVRRCSVFGCVRLFNKSQDLLNLDALIDDLYSLIRDTDPIVIVNSLQALESILIEEGGVVVTKSIAIHLLRKLSTFTDGGLVQVLELLIRYQPESEADVLDIMNMCDFTLTHHCVSVVIAALKYFLFLTKDMIHLQEPIIERSKHVLLSTLGGDNNELIYAVLIYVENVLSEFTFHLKLNYKSFFCRHNEPTFVKRQRIKILPQLICKENMSDVLNELIMTCKDRDSDVSHMSIQALGRVATLDKVDDGMIEKCLDTLLYLMTPTADHVLSEVLHVLQSIYLTDEGHVSRLCYVMTVCDYLQLDLKGKCAYFTLLSRLGEHIESAPYIMETQVNELSVDSGVPLLSALLSCYIRLLVLRPAEMQDVAGRLMELCMKQQDMYLRDKTQFYYTILKDKPDSAKLILAQRRV